MQPTWQDSHGSMEHICRSMSSKFARLTLRVRSETCAMQVDGVQYLEQCIRVGEEDMARPPNPV